MPASTTTSPAGGTAAAADPAATGHEHAEGRLLAGLAGVIAAPLPDLAARLSALIAGELPHSALVLLTEEEVSHPLAYHGDAAIGRRLVLTDVVALGASLAPGSVRRASGTLAGAIHPVLMARADTDGLLILVDAAASPFEDHVLPLWQIVAWRIQQHASEASPSYLLESRAASRVRSEVVTELNDIHSTTLESLLTVLRAADLDDRSARQNAIGLAATSLVQLRTATDTVRRFTEEDVTKAFERLRNDLRPLVRYRDVDMQFVEPPVDGRALPSEVAHGARAIVRGAILAAVDQPGTSRVRVQWDCDGENLLINVRDDGPGDLDLDSAALQPLRQRVLALNGRVSLAATEGWGTELSVVMPLDPPPTHAEDTTLGDLAPRELEVLDLLAAGRRNGAIARELGISENTVKFHVSKIFRKLDVHSRSELAALVLAGRAGVARGRPRS